MKTLKTLLMTLCLVGVMHTEAKTVVLGVPQALDSLKKGDELIVKDFRLVLTAAERVGAVRGWRAAIDGVECAAVYRGPSGWFVDINDFENGRVYQVREDRAARSANAWTVTEADPNREPTTCSEPLRPTKSAPRVVVPKRAARATDVLQYVDVLFAFDAGGREYVENTQHSTLEEYAAAQLLKMNEVMANSKLDDRMRFRYAGTVAVSARTDSLDTALVNAQSGASGWEAIPEAREKYGADLVSVSVDTGSAYGVVGLGYALPTVDEEEIAWYGEECPYHAISVMAAYVHQVEMHETGHNLGAGHSDLLEPEPQSAPYSFGYYFNGFLGTGYHTIMSYNIHPISGRTYVAAPLFSSPDLTWSQRTAGTPTNDNRRVLMETHAACAQWRPPHQSALGPSFELAAGEFEEGVQMGDLTLQLNGNAIDETGAIVIGDSQVGIVREGVMALYGEAEGTEMTVVLTLENVDTAQPGTLLSLDSLARDKAVGVGFGAGGKLSGVASGSFPYAKWTDFGTYANGKAQHRIAFGYAAPTSGKGSGDYRGCVFAMDGRIVGSCTSLVYGGDVSVRANLGTKGARIKRIAVYTGAISEARLKEATMPDGPTYDWVSYCSGVSHTSTPLAKDVTASRQMKVAFLGQFDASETSAIQLAYYEGDANDIYLKTDSSGELFLKMARKTTGDELKTMSGKKLTPGAHRFGLYVRRGPGVDGHEVSIIATMDGEELARIGDGKLRFDTNPMHRWYFGDSTKPNNCYTAHYVEPEAAVAEDAKTIATLIRDVDLLYPAANGMISVNFKGGNNNRNPRTIAANQWAGVYPIRGAHWSQVVTRTGPSSVDGALDAGDVILETWSDGHITTNRTIRVKPYAKCCYTAEGKTTPVSGNGELMYGYLDDGTKQYADKGASIAVENIPYAEYTLYVYVGTDSANGQGKQFGPIYVNGAVYPQDAAWGSADVTHENGSALTLAEGQNYIKVTGLTEPSLSIVGSQSNVPTGTRCGLAGFQIINTGASRVPAPSLFLIK